MFFFFAVAALFYVYKIQNRKPHRKVTKLKSNFTFSWFSLIGFSTTWPEGATLLGWAKSIYYGYVHYTAYLLSGIQWHFI